MPSDSLRKRMFLSKRWDVRARSVVLLVLLATGVAYSQKTPAIDDPFITDPALRSYLDKTPYQHGSLHGYEDGYQEGDIDFHLQRPEPDFKKVKEFRTATRGYVDGDKDEYRTGYQEGYQLGYQDAQGGRPFAAFDRLEAAAEHKPVMVAQEDSAPAEDGSEQSEPKPVAAPSKPIKIPIQALFPAQMAVLPPGPSPRDSALARIMNNLRRTFMPATILTPQAVVQGTRR
jgi:hypothetical protein